MNRSRTFFKVYYVEGEQSATSPISKGRGDRIEISVMVPSLDLQFDLNQSANGQTRLLLIMIKSRIVVKYNWYFSNIIALTVAKTGDK